VPEFFADTMLVNGLVYPYVEVEQRKYRFLALNACNSRFLRLRIVYEDPNHPGEPKNGYANPQVGPAFVQYANEGGFLPAPVTLLGTTPQNTMLLGPAERAEWTIDFSSLPAGAKFLLYNDAPGPFPSGDDANDYYPGNPATPMAVAGKGPNTRTIMEFRVKARVGPVDVSKPLVLPAINPPSLLPQAGSVVPVELSLNEDFDSYGRLIQMVGSNIDQGGGFFGIPYLTSATVPGAAQISSSGQLRVWRIANLTGDTHPMHIHLVNWQIISRQPFNPAAYPVITYTGPARGPDANERGWKETVRMNPGEVITLITKFDLPSMAAYIHGGVPVVTIPPSPRLAAMGIPNGNEYVWHCHILEHEEHDMMHALVVTS
jgi:spore coat protein A, manganese oxidase